MMRHQRALTSWFGIGILAMASVLAAGCETLLGIKDTYVATFSVRGAAVGMVAPVSLRLEHSGGMEILSILEDGPFEFASQLGDGASFTVTISSANSDCTVEGAVGVVAGDSVQMSLFCPLALADLQLTSARVPASAFAPTNLSPEVEVSLLQDSTTVTATARSAAIELTVAGMAVPSGEPSSAIPLSLGINEIPVVATHVPTGARLTYALTVLRAAAIAQYAYGKASNTSMSDFFGYSVALSGRGDTLAIGTIYEDSAAVLINGTQDDESAADSGAVYVFVRAGTRWNQEAYIKPANTGAGDTFGISVALSESGDTLAVGAAAEDSAAAGINGNGEDNSATDSGAVYVFTRTGQSWREEAYIKASNTGAGDSFGHSVALSAAGNALAVGAPEEASSATGVGGDGADDTAAGSGAVYVFTRTGESWDQDAYIKASNTEAGDHFGYTVALSGTGDTLAVGAIQEDSNATGVDGDQASNEGMDRGAVYVFVKSGAGWAQQAYIKASTFSIDDQFGASLALSATGDTLAVGAIYEDSAVTGVNADPGDEVAYASGAVFVFVRDGGSFRQEAYIKASNTGADDMFGAGVALSSTGDTLAVGAPLEGSNAVGVGGDQADNSAGGSGAVYVFVRTAEGFRQEAYIKASNTGAEDSFGKRVALSNAGDTLAVGAHLEDSSATGINGDDTLGGEADSGAVYVFY